MYISQPPYTRPSFIYLFIFFFFFLSYFFTADCSTTTEPFFWPEVKFWPNSLRLSWLWRGNQSTFFCLNYNWTKLVLLLLILFNQPALRSGLSGVKVLGFKPTGWITKINTRMPVNLVPGNASHILNWRRECIEYIRNANGILFILFVYRRDFFSQKTMAADRTLVWTWKGEPTWK